MVRGALHTIVSKLSSQTFIYYYSTKQNMEESSISTNVTIDFNKKPTAPVKRTYKPRTPSSHAGRSSSHAAHPAPKKIEHPKPKADFTPKQGEFPVKI